MLSNLFWRSESERRPVIPPYPKRPQNYRQAQSECDYNGYSCHHCFKSAPFSDAYPYGKHWPCPEHWGELSWYCLGCNQSTHARWGSPPSSARCQHCQFPRNGISEDLDPIKCIRIKVIGLTDENCQDLADSLCEQADELMEKFSYVKSFSGKWRCSEAKYLEVMNLPATTVNGYGMRQDHVINIYKQKIFNIIKNYPCNLHNLIRVACYNAYLSRQKEGYRVEDLVHDKHEYYAELKRACVPTTGMIEEINLIYK